MALLNKGEVLTRRILSFGLLHVELLWDGHDPHLYRALLACSLEPATERRLYRLIVRQGSDPSLYVSRTEAVIILPDRIPTITAVIAVLQAAARTSTANASKANVLLHGSSIIIHDELSRGVAVLDGGCGVGKSSLALALALERDCTLLADEFSMARVDSNGYELYPAPLVPWHLRADSANTLLGVGHHEVLAAPGTWAKRFAFADTPVPLETIVVPCRSRAPEDSVSRQRRGRSK